MKYVLSVVFALGLFASAQAAPILELDGQGELIGAKGVIVDGEAFDVTFLDGRFTDIFGDSSGLDATTAQEALAFSDALGDQVFNEANAPYDLDSGKTRGCHNNWRAYCYIYTPFADIVGLQLSVGYFLNRGAANNEKDKSGTTATGRWVDTGSFFPAGDYVYADWSASLDLGNDEPGDGEPSEVPAPPAALLFALALLGLRLRRQTALV